MDGNLIGASLSLPLGWIGDAVAVGLTAPMRIALIIAGALTLWVLFRGLARAQRRVRVLGEELARLQMQLLGIERLQFEADKKAARDGARLDQLERAQRRAASGLGKPDHTLARAMARAGADERALVDCGLSHAESHLVRALDATRRETDSAVISSTHEH